MTAVRDPKSDRGVLVISSQRRQPRLVMVFGSAKMSTWAGWVTHSLRLAPKTC